MVWLPRVSSLGWLILGVFAVPSPDVGMFAMEGGVLAFGRIRTGEMSVGRQEIGSGQKGECEEVGNKQNHSECSLCGVCGADCKQMKVGGSYIKERRFLFKSREFSGSI